MGATPWPDDPRTLQRLQTRLASLQPQTWSPSAAATQGGCFICFTRGGSGPGAPGERAWATAVVTEGRRIVARSQAEGVSGASYQAGLLAAREGPLLEAALRGLSWLPDVVLVNATGRDHPRRAGLALHLGWVLGVPTVGVTHRPFLAAGSEPELLAGSASPLLLDSEQVGWLLRTRSGARPVAVSPGWGTDLDTSRIVVMDSIVASRTPEPLRQARRLARTARGRASFESERGHTGRVARTQQDLVDEIRACSIGDERLIEAFAVLPRADFVPPRLAGMAYEDRPLPIPHDQVTTQPSLLALMIEALELGPSDRVLEVGTGYGFQTALLAFLCSHVSSIEVWDDLAEQARINLAAHGIGNVDIRVGDGSLGVPDNAPFDAVLVSAAFARVPPPLVDQLAETGRLVQPIGPGGHDTVTLFRKVEGNLIRVREVIEARFVRLVGEEAFPK